MRGHRAVRRQVHVKVKLEALVWALLRGILLAVAVCSIPNKTQKKKKGWDEFLATFLNKGGLQFQCVSRSGHPRSDSQGSSQQPVNHDVRVATDGRREVSVERHVQSIVTTLIRHRLSSDAHEVLRQLKIKDKALILDYMEMVIVSTCPWFF
jgi:hypothetical protein